MWAASRVRTIWESCSRAICARASRIASKVRIQRRVGRVRPRCRIQGAIAVGADVAHFDTDDRAVVSGGRGAAVDPALGIAREGGTGRIGLAVGDVGEVVAQAAASGIAVTIGTDAAYHAGK